MVTDMMIEDIKFLLQFAPATCPDQVVDGLISACYVTGTYAGDVELAKRTKLIIDQWKISLNDDDEEDFA